MSKSKKLKLLVSDTAPLYPPLWGGPLRIWNLFGELPKDFEIIYVGTVFAWGNKYTEVQIKPNVKEIKVPITKLYYPFRWFELKFLKGLTFELFSYLFMSFDFRFKRILRKQDADILISSHPWAFPCLKKKRKDQLLIYDSHNCEYLLMKAITKKRWYRNFVCFLVKLIERSACKKSDFIFACSKEDIKTFIDLYNIPKEKIYYLPNGANLKLSISKEEKNLLRQKYNFKKLILFIGTYFNPNIEAVRFIIDKLSKELNDCLFLIVGWVKGAFNTDHIPHNVKFLGRIDDDELCKIMNIVDLAINPVNQGSGINIKMLDYLSTGLPVVSTSVGARGLGAINGKHLIISNLDDFADNINKILNDKELSDRLRLHGKEFIEKNFLWKDIRGSVIKILKDKIQNGVSFRNHSNA
ncbi:MAG: glycosyltransferase family 4 protein [Candidatus Omnitrophica bacterium]|nr:glycosyltransferase family 4 protein [Candidatus Omnitrophota bacterium]